MADGIIHRATATGPVNIATLKYWGKRDNVKVLPTNSSISVTLDQSRMCARTTAACGSTLAKDELYLNGELSDISGARTQACLRELRSKRAAVEAADPSLPKLSSMPLLLVSKNNFPTAAGLASSAAGFAALVRAIADLYELPDSPSELSIIARQGSGSACRSLFGGYVAWEMGSRDDGLDSKAVQVAPASHWPTMRALVLVVSHAKKETPSTIGMAQTLQTSGLFQQRVAHVAPTNYRLMEQAIHDKNFPQFAEVTMRDSNSFHACCADTYPPIWYMNDCSKAAVRAVESINRQAGKTIAAYTYDAGPNCVVYYEEENREAILGAFYEALSKVGGWDEGTESIKTSVKIEENIAQTLAGGVSRVIMTGVGEGPLKSSEHLVTEDGKPVL